MERVAPVKPLSRTQFVIAILLGLGKSHGEVATELKMKRTTVRAHIRYASKRIPGDLPQELKLVAWVRGATIDVLEGRTLSYEFMRDARRGVVEAPEEQVESLE